MTPPGRVDVPREWLSSGSSFVISVARLPVPLRCNEFGSGHAENGCARTVSGCRRSFAVRQQPIPAADSMICSTADSARRRYWQPFQPGRQQQLGPPGRRVGGLTADGVEDTRVVNASSKLLLKPVFQAGFKPVSYVVRPERRVQDAIAEIRCCGIRGGRRNTPIDAPRGDTFPLLAMESP
ncbi:hypothetical protein [Nocardia sp. NPDC004604]|uniref:hypothetical protein n=1 Tax=Nocardia sp. NPDC004604 TaxID=3157013 RepID=UPI00339DB924